VRGTGADNKVEVDLRKSNDVILSVGRPERQADGSIKWVVPEQ
jgi:hypothetical protein